MYNYLMNKDIKLSRQARPVPQDRLTIAVRENQAASDIFDEALSQFLGINRTDGRCVDIIDRFGRITAGQLAAESGLTTGAVTVVIDRLEAAGYVQRLRDKDDRRKVWIETTEATRAIIERIFGHYAALGPNVLATFAPDQVAAIVRFLEGGSIIQRHMADILKQHTDPRSKDLTERLIQARAFERAAISSAPDLVATIRNLPPLESE
ncbi:MarR family winged helix-turn-helix transcriptional regulator [Paradevosia shaoguanensis]|uniref:MarR family winged helix-turn-helix transcriptional regulator n=1 Tax=Paradevosia shaoguanensis TaxID=1335043 RepID=UPI0019344081|nr:MarR family transcriptional regulator [Paradevosia shaoguanensis]